METRCMLYKQIESINEKIKIIKKNQTKILEMKSSVTKIKN